MLSRRLVAVFATLILAGCNQAQSTLAIDRLQPCAGDDTPVDAYCGTLTVYEDRDSSQGRQIDLNIVVLPALRRGAVSSLGPSLRHRDLDLLHGSNSPDHGQ